MKTETLYKSIAYDGKEFHSVSKSEAEAACLSYETGQLDKLLDKIRGHGFIRINDASHMWRHVIEYTPIVARVFDAEGTKAMTNYLTALSKSGLTRIDPTGVTFTDDMVGKSYQFTYKDGYGYYRSEKSMEEKIEELGLMVQRHRDLVDICIQDGKNAMAVIWN
ncbi:hypothetical protein [uncultured Duncaniella sp.]|uniref:hypothetical protein n=1 Tax=uncultured Duncaniella sp. TaxID=2768039 RepID=UPI00262CB8AF|nr:hypothetical protein [uncultured Duncaniella sp.]